MAGTVEQWMCEELEKLGLQASEENAKYILSIDTASEIQEYMQELLGDSDPKVIKFIQELLTRWRHPEKHTAYNHSSKSPQRNGTHSPRLSPNPKDVKKKTKYVPLYSQEGQEKTVIKLPGRHTCECQASKHSLINNCLKCGRIVCQQEGSGPCLHCGSLVCTPEEQAVLLRGSRKSEQLRQRLMRDTDKLQNQEQRTFYLNTSSTKALEQAVQHKNKLLEYDRTSTRRTQVIDDESDYFATDSNKWLSEKERERLRARHSELHNLRHASKKDRKITLDFAGRQVLEAENDVHLKMYDVNDEVIQQIHYGAKPKIKQYQPDDEAVGDIVNPYIHSQPPQFVGTDSTVRESKTNSVWVQHGEASKRKAGLRIQDRELQEMSDEGVCMSMHQPWASLLVCGIKMHEGRTWYTPHRGRLWIAATAKEPSAQEIADVEQSYRYLLKNPGLEFPSHYPVGCLLGCVDVEDCLAQDEYQKKYPDGESASPFVFICEVPQQLVVKFPIKGKHKIYKLEQHIHQAAKKGLKK